MAKLAPCRSYWMGPMIRYNGDVLLCDINRKHVIGNIRENTFEEIWYSKEMEELRKNALAGRKSKLPDRCRSCIYRKPMSKSEIDLYVKATEK